MKTISDVRHTFSSKLLIFIAESGILTRCTCFSVRTFRACIFVAHAVVLPRNVVRRFDDRELDVVAISHLSECGSLPIRFHALGRVSLPHGALGIHFSSGKPEPLISFSLH